MNPPLSLWSINAPRLLEQLIARCVMVVRLGRGMLAGLVATLVISLFMILRLVAGIIPSHSRGF